MIKLSIFFICIVGVMLITFQIPHALIRVPVYTLGGFVLSLVTGLGVIHLYEIHVLKCARNAKSWVSKTKAIIDILRH